MRARALKQRLSVWKDSVSRDQLPVLKISKSKMMKWITNRSILKKKISTSSSSLNILNLLRLIPTF